MSPPDPTPQHLPNWQRLSELLDRADRAGLPGLSPEELTEIGRLYRRVAGHLAEARTAGADEETIRYLNQLVSRAYARVYAGSRPRRLGVVRMFTVEIPQTFRRHAKYIGVSVGLSLIAALISFSAVRSDGRWADALMSRGGPEAWREFAESGKAAGEYFGETAESMGGPELSSFLMTNNIRVALTAFALGVTLGLGTLYVLTVNGLMLGVFFGVGGNAEALLRFASIIAPHGVLELSAIFIAGGAGLMLGHAIVDPGDRFRRDALRDAASEAVKLALGTVPMFVVAGIIEGNVSPQSTGLFADDFTRILFGLMVGAAFWLYLFFGDRLWGARKEGPDCEARGRIAN